MAGILGRPPVYPLGRAVCAAGRGPGGVPQFIPSGGWFAPPGRGLGVSPNLPFRQDVQKESHRASDSHEHGVRSLSMWLDRTETFGPYWTAGSQGWAPAGRGFRGCPPIYPPGRVGGTKNIPQPRKRNITLRGTHGVAIRLGFLAPVSRFLRLSAPRAQRTPASPASARAPQASPGYPLPPRAPGGRYERSSLAACPARPR